MISIVDRLLEQVPQHIVSSHPMFVTFLRAYFEWLEKQGPVKDIRSLQDMADLDYTTDDYVDYYLNILVPTLPKDITFDKRQLLRFIDDLRQTKGSEESYNLLFQILFGESVQITYPRDNVFRLSDGNWAKDEVVLFTSSFTDIALILNKYVRQEVQPGVFVEGIVTDVQTNITSGYFVNKINISDSTGDFLLDPNLPLVIDEEYYEWVYPVVTDFTITDAGQNYVKGDRIELPKENSFLCERMINNNNKVNLNYSTFLKKEDLIVYVNDVLTTDYQWDGVHVLTFPNHSEGDMVKVYLPSIPGFVSVRETGTNSGIEAFTFLSNPIGYTDPIGSPTVESQAGTGAVLTPVATSLYKIDGYYTNNKGQLSDRSFLHDGEYYQNYSYVILSNRNIDEYQDIVKNTIHPAGTKMYGALDMFEKINMSFSQVQDLSRSIFNVEFPKAYQVNTLYQNTDNLAAQIQQFKPSSYPLYVFKDFTVDFNKKTFFDPYATDYENHFVNSTKGFIGNNCTLTPNASYLEVANTAPSGNFYKTFPALRGINIPNIRIKIKQVGGDFNSTWHGYLGWSIEHYDGMEVSDGRYTKIREPENRDEWTVINIDMSFLFEWNKRKVNGVNFSLSAGASDVWQIEYVLIGNEVNIDTQYTTPAHYNFHTMKPNYTSGSETDFDARGVRVYSTKEQKLFGCDIPVSVADSYTTLPLIEYQAGDVIEVEYYLTGSTVQSIVDSTVVATRGYLEVDGSDGSVTYASSFDAPIVNRYDTALVQGVNKIQLIANASGTINLANHYYADNSKNGVGSGVRRVRHIRNYVPVKDYMFTDLTQNVSNSVDLNDVNLAADPLVIDSEWTDNADKTYTLVTDGAVENTMSFINPSVQTGKTYTVEFDLDVVSGGIVCGASLTNEITASGTYQVHVFVDYDGEVLFKNLLGTACNLTVSNIRIVESNTAVLNGAYTLLQIPTINLLDGCIYTPINYNNFVGSRSQTFDVKLRSESGNIKARLYYLTDVDGGTFNPNNYVDLINANDFVEGEFIHLTAKSKDVKGNWNNNNIIQLALIDNIDGDTYNFTDLAYIDIKEKPYSDKVWDNEERIIYNDYKMDQTLYTPQENISYEFGGIDAQQVYDASKDLLNTTMYYAPNRVREFKDAYNAWPIVAEYYRFSFTDSLDGFVGSGCTLEDTSSYLRVIGTQTNYYIEKNGLNFTNVEGKMEMAVRKLSGSNGSVKVAFKTVEDNTWDANKEFSVNMPELTNTEFRMNMDKVNNARWNSETITDIRIHFVGFGASELHIDYVTFREVIDND